jgi:carbamoyltransferase
MTILGLGGLHSDPACAIVRDGRLAAAVEEEKLRHPQPGTLPEHAIDAALKSAKVTAAQVDCVALARPFPNELTVSVRRRFPNARIVLVDHHEAHAASAFYLSPFPNATVLTLDRYGDTRCGARWKGEGNSLTLEREAMYPDSLGELYSQVTRHLGFDDNADEHKVQWMSAAGQPVHKEAFLEGFTSDASNWLRVDARRVPEGAPADVAASLQAAIEQMVLRLAGTGENLCLAGGLFYNAMLVAALEASGSWKNVFVQPVAGDTGTALGAACFAWHAAGHTERIPFDSLALGPGFAPEEIKQVLENCKLRFRLLLTTDEVIAHAVRSLDEHKIIAWMQDRMEFGPRALGNRSILASPRDPYASENLNTFIKHREGFRKFAASVPAELASEYFEVGSNARHLATVGRVRPEYRAALGSALLDGDRVRVHTVSESVNPLYHRLLHAAGKETGLPVLYNTSFNLFGDPLVCTPRDAVRSFYSSGIDAMLVGMFLLEK